MGTLLSRQKYEDLISLAKRCEKLTGLAAEVGVYKAGSLIGIARALPNHIVVGFDTFQGLPDQDHDQSEYHAPQEFRCSLEEVRNLVSGIKNIHLVSGYFPDEMGSASWKFCFVHLDMDFGRGIKKALEWFWPKMVDNGIVVIDDYDFVNCPNVKPVVDEFCEKNNITLTKNQGSQCWLQKGG